jgi:nucleotide-binding universal stress UspA family protein
MNRSFPPTSIVVGVDDSKASVRAAIWAIDEAISRDIPLRRTETRCFTTPIARSSSCAETNLNDTDNPTPDLFATSVIQHITEESCP